MHSGLSTEAQAGRCPAEFPKLLCKMEMLPGGNSEIVGMLPSGCRRKLRNGMLLGGNSEIVGMLPSGCPAEILKCMGMLPSRWRKFRNWGILCKDGGNVIKWQVVMSVGSDGHGNLFPHGYAGTGMAGTGTGTKILPRAYPVPVVTGHGSDWQANHADLINYTV